MAVPDITYACHDGMWTRFYPETPAGEEAYRVMVAADPEGQVAYLEAHLPGVLAQLRAAGYRVAKAKKQIPMSDAKLAAALAELDALIA